MGGVGPLLALLCFATVADRASASSGAAAFFLLIARRFMPFMAFAFLQIF